MIVLGVTHPVSYNVAAAIVVDGRLVAAAEEERFIRVKHAPHAFASNAIEYVLKEAGVKPSDVDLIASTWRGPSPGRNLPTKLFNVGTSALVSRAHGLNLAEEFGWGLMSTQYEVGLGIEMKRIFGGKRIVYVPHHVCHAASSSNLSGFKRSLVVTLDGRGESQSGLLGIYDQGELEVIKSIGLKESLGHLYGELTKMIGFRYHTDEGKTMGLAPYGKVIENLKDLVEVEGTTISIDWKRLGQIRFSDVDRGPDPTRDYRGDLAATAQFLLEKAAVGLVKGLKELSNSDQLCLAGGVALNIDMNASFLSENLVKKVYVQPASHDAGCAVGAALYLYHEKTGEIPKYEMKHAYLGPDIDDEAARGSIERSGASFKRIGEDDIPSEIGECLARGEVVGWMHGRMEFGPRALGARSLLASPSNPGMWKRVNEIKGREWWRPVAPSILEEEAPRYLNETFESPFMLLRMTTRDLATEKMPAVIHVDGSTRPQTVSEANNPAYWRTIKEFRRLTGVPAVINTSLNLKGDPICLDANDGLKTFFLSGIDVILIGNYFLRKNAT